MTKQPIKKITCMASYSTRKGTQWGGYLNLATSSTKTISILELNITIDYMYSNCNSIAQIQIQKCVYIYAECLYVAK
jgi:hypothetical protein